jgi:pimeloyl-ACP methyl ester carboxylesterase
MRTVIGLVGLYLAILLATYALTNKLILPGRRGDPLTTPAAAGLAFEDLRISVDDATYMHAWWVPAAQPSRRVILFFHGNYESLETEATAEVPLLHATDANVLVVDYRGYGSSSPLQASGPTTEADARAALRYLTEQRHVALSNIVLAGRSIGAGVATQLAVESPEIAGLILMTPVTSIADVANQSWTFRCLLRPVEWFTRASNFDTEAKITAVHAPLLIVAGTRDALARPWMAERIHERANAPKSLHMVEGADHNDIVERMDTGVRRALRAFVTRDSGASGA